MKRKELDYMYKLFKSKGYGYVLELWGASTKHPDSVFYFSDFKKTEIFEDEIQIFQWLLECASRLTFPFNAKTLTEWALENYYPSQYWKIPDLPEYSTEHWYRG